MAMSAAANLRVSAALLCGLLVACEVSLSGVPIRDEDPGDNSEGEQDGSEDELDAGAEDASSQDAAEDASSADDEGGPPDCVEGPVIIDGESAMAQRELACVRGDLQLATTGSVDMPRLVEVSGRVEFVEIPALVNLPALRTIGSLVMETATPYELSLPALTHVEGDVTVRGGDVLHTLSLSALKRIEGTMSVDASELNELELPVLTYAKELLLEVVSPALDILRFTALESTERFRLGGGTPPNSLRTLLFSALTTAGEISIVAPALQTLKLPKLSECQSLSVHVAEYAVLNVYELKRVDGTLELQNGYDFELANLEEVGRLVLRGINASFAPLEKLHTVDELLIADAAELLDFALPALTSVGSIEIRDAPKLDMLNVNQLNERTQVRLLRLPSLRIIRVATASAVALFELEDLDDLTGFNLPLTAVQSMRLASCDVLSSPWLPELQTLDDLELTDLPRGRFVDLGAVTRLQRLKLGGALGNLEFWESHITHISTLDVQGTDLHALRLDALTDLDDATIESNALLGELHLLALRRIHNRGSIKYSPYLSACKVDEINARLESEHVFETFELGPCSDPW